MKKKMFGCASIALTFVGLALPAEAKGCIIRRVGRQLNKD
jgi:hypothetical protein